MKNFAQLYTRLEQTTSIDSKIDALVEYFESADNVDRVWAIALFSHHRPKRTFNTALLKEWSIEVSKIPLWLFEESYKMVGDVSETIALIIPKPFKLSKNNLTDWLGVISRLGSEDEETKKRITFDAWCSLDQEERFVFNKLLTGGFRMNLPQKIIVQALSNYTGIEEKKLSHRLTGNWDPSKISFQELVINENPDEDQSRPFPFHFGHSITTDIQDLGDESMWSAERIWDGVRSQLILRNGAFYLWTKTEELVNEKFPELDVIGEMKGKNIVVEGEILAFRDGRPLSINILKKRMGRKNLTKKHLAEAPVIFMAYDLLEYDGNDIRENPLENRREVLKSLIEEMGSDKLRLSQSLPFDSWDALEKERSDARLYLTKGIIIKKQKASYKPGRQIGDWWKWKVEPLTIDAVMLYAQKGKGRQSKVFTEYTFAVKSGDDLIPFTKASSGLTEEEIEEVTKFVKENTKERFGPVSSINPELVFELAFDGIDRSKRHKSGVVLRAPRIKCWKKEKSVADIDSLDDLDAILTSIEGDN